MPVLRTLAAASALCAAALCGRAAPPQVTVLDTLGSAVADPLCGYWMAGADGAKFEIRAGLAPGLYAIYLLSSPDMALAPGTALGTMRHTGTEGNYDVELADSPGKRGLQGRKKNYIFEVNAEGTELVMRHYRRGKSVSIHRLLPYFFRISLKTYDTRPQGIDGARRIAPVPRPKKLSL